MTLILGMTELVRNRTQDERLKPILNNVMDAATGLTRMLNDLIDLAALETRQVAFQFAPLSMPELAADALQLLEPQARQKGLQMFMTIDGEGSTARHVGDAHRIQQVLASLLDNAVKFAPQALSAWPCTPSKTRRSPPYGVCASPTRASGLRRAISIASSPCSSRWTDRPPAASRAPGWGWRCANAWSRAWAAAWVWRASRARAAASGCCCRCPK